MAITFEEKSNAGKQIAAFVALFALVAIAGFMGWRLIQNTQVEPETVSLSKVQIDKKILTDQRIVSLELFPEIPPATVGGARENPFVKNVPAATEDIADGADESQPN